MERSCIIYLDCKKIMHDPSFQSDQIFTERIMFIVFIMLIQLKINIIGLGKVHWDYRGIYHPNYHQKVTGVILLNFYFSKNSQVTEIVFIVEKWLDFLSLKSDWIYEKNSWTAVSPVQLSEPETEVQKVQSLFPCKAHDIRSWSFDHNLPNL